MAPVGEEWEPRPPDDVGWFSQPPRPPSAPLCVRGAKGASIEDQVRLSFYTPSPQHYHPKEPEHFKEMGGRISEARVPSCLDAEAKMRRSMPGPASYNTRNFEGLDLPEGGKLNTVPPRESVSVSHVFADPGPGQYTPLDPMKPTVTHGRCFGKDPREPQHIRDAVNQSRGMPGPGAYDMERAAEFADPFCPEGGRALMAAKPESYFDAVAKLTASNPGPNSYMLPGAVDKKPQSEAIWRHESETFAESKAIVEGILNLKMVTPGPGAYDMPDGATKPIVGPPTLKTRKLPHGMPPPFAYNCTKDLCSKFVPFRQRNSSTMIYEGKGGQKLTRPSSTPVLADESGLSRTELRAKRRQESVIPGSTGRSMQEPDPEQQPASDEGFIRPFTRSGSTGMARRSHSAGSMVASTVDHPSVKEATKHYPKLAGRKGRATHHFLPMAARRVESLGTKDLSENFQRYHYSRKQMEDLGAATHDLSKIALESFDLDKLMQDSVQILEHKARSQLKVEGLSRDRRRQVLEELPALFDPPSTKMRKPEDQSAFFDVDGFADEPFDF